MSRGCHYEYVDVAVQSWSPHCDNQRAGAKNLSLKTAWKKLSLRCELVPLQMARELDDAILTLRAPN